MADINVRSDSVDVEQIMGQIRARIREKRGADYTEDELRQLANVKLQQFLDPRGVRSDLVEAFRKHRTPSPPIGNFAFEDTTLFETHRGPLRLLRRLLQPVLKLFFNPNKISDALHLQAKVNAEVQRQLAEREGLDPLYFEVVHNLVLEVTRLGIEVQNLSMRVESLSNRLDFDERRARSLETVVEYKPGAAAPRPEAPSEGEEASGAKRRRRRRRRRRPGRTGGEAAAGGAPDAEAPNQPAGDEPRRSDGESSDRGDAREGDRGGDGADGDGGPRGSRESGEGAGDQ